MGWWRVQVQTRQSKIMLVLFVFVASNNFPADLHESFESWWKIFAHVCKHTSCLRDTFSVHFSFCSFLPPSFFSFFKNHLHNNSCECTHAATDNGPEMIQWWRYESILTIIQLDFAEPQLRKWALKPEHVNICQLIDLLPIILLYILILFTNGAPSRLVSLRTWTFYSHIAFAPLQNHREDDVWPNKQVFCVTWIRNTFKSPHILRLLTGKYNS